MDRFSYKMIDYNVKDQKLRIYKKDEDGAILFQFFQIPLEEMREFVNEMSIHKDLWKK